MDFYLKKVREALERATEGMTPEQLERHPGEKWSAAQILEHLSLTYTGTIKAMEKCLQAGKPMASSPTMYQRLAVTLVVGLGHMPEGRTAPAHTVPHGMSGREALTQIRTNLDAMEEAIVKCERQFGARVKIADHTILGPLSAPEWRKFHWVHGRHHAKQIERLRENEKRSGESENLRGREGRRGIL
jgi:DinB family protein